MLFPELKVETGAVFSSDMRYRYKLWRIWNRQLPLVNFILLNPSTADAEEDDPTVYCCGQRARHMGYGGLLVTNVFAFRSTDPGRLYEIDDPVGPENDDAIITEAKRAAMVVCGWGKLGKYMGRATFVCDLLRLHKVYPHALNLNGDGSPEHPLYQPYSRQPIPYYTREALLADA